MHRFKISSKIDQLLEYLEHALEAARHDAHEHSIDASRILQHLHAAREDMLEAVKELEKTILTIDGRTAQPSPPENDQA